MMPHAPHYQTVPLNSWGSFRGRRRLTESPYIESAWEGIAQQSGTHYTAADGSIDLMFQTRQNSRRVILSGPTSHAYTTTFEAGDEVLTIRLRAGVHVPMLASSKLVDTDLSLPSAHKNGFWLRSTVLTLPDFDNVETFMERAAKLGLIQRSTIVEEALSKKQKVGLRTTQRHFLATTGLTMNRIYQIKRAEQARTLLGNNHTLASIAYETGYSNPGHMTNAFNYFFGQTPSSLRTLMRNN